MLRLLLAFVLLLPLGVNSQNLDSLSRSIDSNSKIMQQSIDSLNKRLDSHYARIEFRRNEENIEKVMNQIRENEKKQTRQMYIRIGLGVAFLAVLGAGLLRRRKK